jgi:Zn-dependent alcohol dehydrogenase
MLSTTLASKRVTLLVSGLVVFPSVVRRYAYIRRDYGLGPIGQCAARWALLKGASRVIGIDNVPYRLAFASSKSGVEAIDFSVHTDVVKRIQELVPGGLDVALDCGMN